MPSRPRKTQQQKSAETRQLLLDATIESLVEKGYAATTIKEVCDRAGLTRGAQLHHFETKEQLVLQAVRHLFEVRLRQWATAFEALPWNAKTDRSIIDLMWPILFESPFFVAWLEILIASRTNPELRNAVQAVDRDFDDAVLSLSRRISITREPTVKLFLALVFAFMSGMVIESRFGKGFRGIDVPVANLLGLLKEFADFLADNPRVSHKYEPR